MKFTDGVWRLRDGVDAAYAREAYDFDAQADRLVVTAPTSVISSRGDTLNKAALTVTITSPLPNIIGVLIEHYQGGGERRGFDLHAEADIPHVSVDERGAAVRTGDLTAHVAAGHPWSLTFDYKGRILTRSGEKTIAYLGVDPSAPVDTPAANSSPARTERSHFVSQQLSLDVGELIYGLGERFGPLVKNGQTVDTWNADGGTMSEQAYKNLPFYISNRGFGVLVDHPGNVSFEIGSENVEQVQFSVNGERLQYYVIAGDDPSQVLERYTLLTGRPPRVPAWSYGTWLSTSFTTRYDEATVNSFIDGMIERDLPLSVFHFDCFWMREFNWCDFEWDPRVFPDPVGMIQRLHSRGLKVCVWINPYIGQRSPLFAEAKAAGYLLKRTNGDVWQWDQWQAGMAIVDFTNPDAAAWYKAKLLGLLHQGVDTFKTDFGERIPTDVRWHDGSDPEVMHNWYTQLYNRAVFEVLDERAPGEAMVFARSATVGGQQYPVHWGGDSASTFVSMAESLRGGLSLAMGGFGFWSHDIGGFEGMPDPAVFKRWTAFGLLSTHSRFHGSDSYRVPWDFDEEAVEVTRRFARLKMSLMPYLFAAGGVAADRGTPVMRPLALEFPGDPAVAYLDRQYMLGSELLVAPVFSADGEVDFYVPDGHWTEYFSGKVVRGGRWLREKHGFDSLPLYVRPNGLVPTGSVDDRPDYAYLDDVVIVVTAGAKSVQRSVTITEPGGRTATFHAAWSDTTVTITSDFEGSWSACLPGTPPTAVSGRQVELAL